MLNMTARIAVSVQNLLDKDFDWNDSTPSHDVNDLTINDILPSAADAAAPKALVYSVIKKALRSSGANATQKHIEEVSLAALFSCS